MTDYGLDPSWRDPEVVLSNNDRTATIGNYSGGAGKVSRSVQSRNTGKWYWEVLNVTNSSYILFGVANSSFPTTKYVGEDTNSWGWNYLGRLYYNASYSGGHLTFGNNARLMFALDSDAGKLWLGVNGSWRSGISPSTGSNADATAAGLQNSMYFVQTMMQAYGTSTVYLRDEDLLYTPPTGFNALFQDFTFNGFINREARIMVIKNSGWYTEYSAIHQPGNFSLNLTKGAKTIVGICEDTKEVITYGNIYPGNPWGTN